MRNVVDTVDQLVDGLVHPSSGRIESHNVDRHYCTGDSVCQTHVRHGHFARHIVHGASDARVHQVREL